MSKMDEAAMRDLLLQHLAPHEDEDTGKAKAALKALEEEEKAAREEEEARKEALKAVEITKANLITLVKELDMPLADADRLLREHGDDVVSAMRAFVRA